MTKWLKTKWTYVAIAALFLLLVLLPFDWSFGQYNQLWISIGIATMVTVGLCLLMGYTGQVSLGQAAFYGIGAYVSGVLTAFHSINPWLAMIIAAIATGAFAYIIGYPIFRLRGNYLALATLAIGVIVAILLSRLGPGGPDGFTGIPYLSIGGFEFDTSFKRYFLVWGFCIAILLISQNIIRSRTGRALRAIHGSESAAESIGINVAQFKVKILVLSAVYASLAGSLFAHHLRHISPHTFDAMASVKFVVMAVIGGLASIWGAIFGAGTTKWLSDELLLGFGQWDIVIYGFILMLVMILTPEGLFVAIRSGFDWLRRNWRDLPSISRDTYNRWQLKLRYGWRRAEP